MGNQFQYRQGNFNQGNPSIGQQQNNPSGQIGGFRQQQLSPLWQQINQLTENVRDFSNRFDKFLKVYESQHSSNQTNFRSLEMQLGQLSKRIEITEKKNQSRVNTDVNPKEECHAVVVREKRKTKVEVIEISSDEEEVSENDKLGEEEKEEEGLEEVEKRRDSYNG